MLLYDTTILYLHVVNDSIKAGISPVANGDLFNKMARYKEFYGKYL